MMTNARILREPLSTEEAWKQVKEWLELPTVWIPLPTEGHGTILEGMLLKTSATGNLVHDAYLATLAIEHTWSDCLSTLYLYTDPERSPSRRGAPRMPIFCFTSMALRLRRRASLNRYPHPCLLFRGTGR